MIKINKGEAPEILVTTGEMLTESMQSEFDMHMVDYSKGSIKFKFTVAYRSPEVQEALVKCQYNKCCFSEAKFVGDYPNVEHFRPKGRTDEMNPKSSSHPGYYWLAYKWSNLFLCKQLINISYKRNFFPLIEETTRTRTHHENLENEMPLLIDPSKDEPRNHIYFHLDVPTHKDEKGKATIEYLGLKHPHFNEARETKFKLLQGIKALVELLISANDSFKENPIVTKYLSVLEQSKQPTAEFSSMAIDLLQGWNPFQLDLDLSQNS